MKNLLFIAPLKHGMLKEYKKFAETITGSKKKEYSDLLTRYGLKSAKVYLHNIGGTDYAFIYHKAENDALERLSGWAASTHPFDAWFGEQLKNCYQKGWEEAKLLFEFDAQSY